jgi:hypothetical protein
LKYQFWTESVHSTIWSSSLIKWVLCCATRHEPIILIEIQIGNHKVVQCGSWKQRIHLFGVANELHGCIIYIHVC